MPFKSYLAFGFLLVPAFLSVVVVGCGSRSLLSHCSLLSPSCGVLKLVNTRKKKSVCESWTEISVLTPWQFASRKLCSSSEMRIASLPISSTLAHSNKKQRLITVQPSLSLKMHLSDGLLGSDRHGFKINQKTLTTTPIKHKK